MNKDNPQYDSKKKCPNPKCHKRKVYFYFDSEGKIVYFCKACGYEWYA